jgi:hypothetical protein
LDGFSTGGIHTLLRVGSTEKDAFAQQPLIVDGVKLLTTTSNINSETAQISFALINDDPTEKIGNVAVFGSFLYQRNSFRGFVEPFG